MATPVISSTRNPRVRAALGLRERRERERTGLTLVDGRRELGRAIDAGVHVDALFLTRPALDQEPGLVSRAQDLGGSIVLADEAVVGRLAYGDRAEGLVGVVAAPDTSLSSLHLAGDALVVVLEQVQKPGNLGAVVRTADAAGASAVIAADPATDVFNPNAIRASLGTLFTVPVASGTSAEVAAFLRANGLRIVAARVDGELEYTAVDLRGPVAIALGSEAAGLTAAWTGPDVTPVRLPMLGVADSLNVSITAAVLLYEALRQRVDANPPSLPA